VILATTDAVELNDLSMDMPSQGDPDITHQAGDMISIEKLEEAHMRKVLGRVGSIAASAKVLGIDQATIYRKQKRWSEHKREYAEMAC
jgi:NtrC-family two-component system response regulator AlgB